MAKASKPRGSSSTKALSRREEIRRSLPKRTRFLDRFLNEPGSAAATGLLLALALSLTAIVTSGRERMLPRIGEIMTETRTYRVSFETVDDDATDRNREAAATGVPAVYRPNTAWLDDLTASLKAAPRLVRGAESFDAVAPEDREQFGLDEASFAVLAAVGNDETRLRTWTQAVDRLRTRLIERTPLLSAEAYRRYTLQAGAGRRLIRPATSEAGSPTEISLPGNPIEFRVTGDDEVSVNAAALERVAESAVFSPEERPIVAARIAWRPGDSIAFDDAETTTRRDAARDETTPVMVERSAGSIIYARGDRLSVDQFGELITERDEWRAASAPITRWSPRAGIAVTTLLLVAGLGVFLAAGYRRVFENPLRLFAIGSLLAGACGVASLVALEVPQFETVGTLGATLAVAIVVLLAYDARLALFSATIAAMAITLTTRAGVADLVVLLVGAGTFIIALREVRNRDSIIRAGAATAATVAIAALGSQLLVLPPVDGARVSALISAGLAAGSAMAMAFLALGLLPTLERLADITTGMTLAELRDPSRPLLRELQLRAPGTYNHSLQVATIAEAAADAIGADSLLLYVGALYHDVGKMNKPQYFVENQSDGLNKHDKLRPAMSLLVIIGHVKDGMELAREYNLPRSIQHFIESHHGTTLVEYFYHAAKEAAEADENVTVDEVEYRYPGPKPRTREAAILMLSDAVESATRAMSEPNPARIETLVREMSRKRLLDGQFDESDLSFAELRKIEDAMIARLCAIYHGRVKYPKKDEAPAGEATAEAMNGETPNGSDDAPSSDRTKTPAPGATTGPRASDSITHPASEPNQPTKARAS